MGSVANHSVLLVGVDGVSGGIETLLDVVLGVLPISEDEARKLLAELPSELASGLTETQAARYTAILSDVGANVRMVKVAPSALAPSLTTNTENSAPIAALKLEKRAVQRSADPSSTPLPSGSRSSAPKAPTPTLPPAKLPSAKPSAPLPPAGSAPRPKEDVQIRRFGGAGMAPPPSTTKPAFSPPPPRAQTAAPLPPPPSELLRQHSSGSAKRKTPSGEADAFFSARDATVSGEAMTDEFFKEAASESASEAAIQLQRTQHSGLILTTESNDSDFSKFMGDDAGDIELGADEVEASTLAVGGAAEVGLPENIQRVEPTATPNIPPVANGPRKPIPTVAPKAPAPKKKSPVPMILAALIVLGGIAVAAFVFIGSGGSNLNGAYNSASGYYEIAMEQDDGARYRFRCGVVDGNNHVCRANALFYTANLPDADQATVSALADSCRIEVSNVATSRTETADCNVRVGDDRRSYDFRYSNTWDCNVDPGAVESGGSISCTHNFSALLESNGSRVSASFNTDEESLRYEVDEVVDVGAGSIASRRFIASQSSGGFSRVHYSPEIGLVVQRSSSRSTTQELTFIDAFGLSGGSTSF